MTSKFCRFHFHSQFLLITCFVVFLNSCSTYRQEMRRLTAVQDSLASEITELKRQSNRYESELYKLLYETEYLRNAVVKAEADSVVWFYQNFIFNYRRPIEAWVEPDQGSPFLFPIAFPRSNNLWLWRVLWGRLFYFDYNHLGIDLSAAEGDTVRAVYDGIIRHYEPANGYGELVAVVEHHYAEPWKSNLLPKQFISIYGHIRPRARRDSSAILPWKNGDLIRRGNVIGYINDDEHNGDGGEHLHFGIRLQTADASKASDSGRWLRGYDDRKGERLRFFLNPVELYGRYIRFSFGPESEE